MELPTSKAEIAKHLKNLEDMFDVAEKQEHDAEERRAYLEFIRAIANLRERLRQFTDISLHVANAAWSALKSATEALLSTIQGAWQKMWE